LHLIKDLNTRGAEEEEKNEDEDEENLDDLVAPYQKLLNELSVVESSRRRPVGVDKKKKNKNKRKSNEIKSGNEKKLKRDQESDEEDVDEEEELNEDDKTSDIDEHNIGSYSNEVLCKDNLENEEAIKHGNLCLLKFRRNLFRQNSNNFFILNSGKILTDFRFSYFNK
jgi:hypothetical protein